MAWQRASACRDVGEPYDTATLGQPLTRAMKDSGIHRLHDRRNRTAAETVAAAVPSTLTTPRDTSGDVIPGSTSVLPACRLRLPHVTARVRQADTARHPSLIRVVDLLLRSTSQCAAQDDPAARPVALGSAALRTLRAELHRSQRPGSEREALLPSRPDQMVASRAREPGPGSLGSTSRDRARRARARGAPARTRGAPARARGARARARGARARARGAPARARGSGPREPGGRSRPRAAGPIDGLHRPRARGSGPRAPGGGPRPRAAGPSDGLH